MIGGFLLKYLLYLLLLYRHECFTGNYTTQTIHTKPHSGLKWRIFHILTSEDINAFADIKFVSQIVLKFVGVCDRNIFGFSSKVFGKSSAIFGKFRKMFSNVCATFGQILENLRISSERGRKSSENRQLCRQKYVYIIKRTLHVSSNI